MLHHQTYTPVTSTLIPSTAPVKEKPPRMTARFGCRLKGSLQRFGEFL